MMYLSSATWYLQLPRFSDKSGQSVLAAPPSVQHSRRSCHIRGMLSTQVMSERACRLERTPVGPADSRTTLIVSQTHEVSFTGPAWPASSGLPSTGFSPATCSRRGRCWQPSAASFETRLPVKFAEEAMMHIHAGVPVTLRMV
jgi:hypothetical protein